MNGYEIVYLKSDGSLDLTIFGRPLYSLGLSFADEIDCVCAIFAGAYPDCRILKIIPGEYEGVPVL